MSILGCSYARFEREETWKTNSYLLQCFQALFHSQSITQCSSCRISNSIEFKTVEESTPELVQVVYTLGITDSESLKISGAGGSMHERNLPQPMVNKKLFWTITYYMFTLDILNHYISWHSVYNSLQSFQWLVMVQCSGQSYGSSVCQIIGSEATVHGVRSDMNTLELDPH